MNCYKMSYCCCCDFTFIFIYIRRFFITIIFDHVHNFAGYTTGPGNCICHTIVYITHVHVVHRSEIYIEVKCFL